MKNYAMTIKNKVVGVLFNQETEPKWPPDKNKNPVVAIPCDDTVKVGMIYDPETGTFSECVAQTHQPKPLERIEKLLRTSQKEVENAAIDAYTEELIEGGFL